MMLILALKKDGDKMLSFLMELTNNKVGMVLKCSIICLTLSGGCDLQAQREINNLENGGS